MSKILYELNSDGSKEPILPIVVQPKLAPDGGLSESEQGLQMESPIEIREVEGSITDYIPKATTEQYGLVKLDTVHKNYDNGVKVCKTGNICTLTMTGLSVANLTDFTLDTEFRPKTMTTGWCLFWLNEDDFIYAWCHIRPQGYISYYGMTGFNTRRRAINLSNAEYQKYSLYLTATYGTN